MLTSVDADTCSRLDSAGEAELLTSVDADTCSRLDSAEPSNVTTRLSPPHARANNANTRPRQTHLPALIPHRPMAAWHARMTPVNATVRRFRLAVV